MSTLSFRSLSVSDTFSADKISPIFICIFLKSWHLLLHFQEFLEKLLYLLILAGICFGWTGYLLWDGFGLPVYGRAQVTFPSRTLSITSSTPLAQPTIVASSTVDVNNPETWNTFEFKELGFSMKLPFERSAVTSSYNICEGECLELEGFKKLFQWVEASAPTIGYDRLVTYLFMTNFN
jgi:hypothetical protein